MKSKAKEKGIQISPTFFKSDWDRLNLNGKTSDWATAVSIFEDRMNGRFFRQIDLLDNNKDRKTGIFAGFAIIALDCLLIETLEQFINGRIRTGRGMDEESFFNFFQRTEDFRAFFNTKEKASIFYQQIRCGLLHQAQTKRKSTLNIRNEALLSWIDPSNHKEGISVQRRKFHNEVVKIYKQYCQELRKDKNMNLRGKFRRKMENLINQE